MNSSARPTYVAAATFSALVLGSLALTSSANADPTEQDSSGVEVSVTIAPQSTGELTYSIADDQVTLTEEGSTPTVRTFKGDLPTVTVTDTRAPADIPADVYWAVVGSATNFRGAADQPSIGADHLGWRPHLLAGNAGGLVDAGNEVVTVLDEPTLPGNNVGLVDQELLTSARTSEEVAPGSYSVGAELFLRTAPDVAAGTYKSTLTLSLFE